MNKAELLKQLRIAHEKQLFDAEAVERVLDEYADEQSREFAQYLNERNCDPNDTSDCVRELEIWIKSNPEGE